MVLAATDALIGLATGIVLHLFLEFGSSAKSAETPAPTPADDERDKPVSPKSDAFLLEAVFLPECAVGCADAC